MAGWTEAELNSIDSVDELRIATRRKDGTLRKPVIVWAVCVDRDIFVRAVHGIAGLWYRHATENGKGAISAGGVKRDTMFIPEHNPDVNTRIDRAFRDKYGKYAKSIVDSTLTPQAREATLLVKPE